MANYISLVTINRVNAASMACRVRELKVRGEEAEMGSRVH